MIRTYAQNNKIERVPYMFQFRTYKLKNLNIKLIFGVIALTIIGILVIGSANYEYQSKQILGMILGIIVMGFVALVDYDFVLQLSLIHI